MAKVQQWLESGKYLPKFMRDFHDQKDIFWYMDGVRERSVERNGGPYMANLRFTDAMIYTIDIFLWVMARHGYTLQRSRKDLPFFDLDETVSLSKKRPLRSQCAVNQKYFPEEGPSMTDSVIMRNWP